MSYLVTRLELKERARAHANMENDTFVDDTEINRLVNVHLSRLYDLLVEAGPPDYFSSTQTLTTTPGTIAYALPSTFRSLSGVFVKESTSATRRRRIYPIATNIGHWDAPQASHVVEYDYIPAPPKLTTDSDSVTGTFDFVSGWDEYVVVNIARDMMRKEDRDISSIQMACNEMKAEIISKVGVRDVGAPLKMQDIYSDPSDYFWEANPIRGYILQAGNIKLYQRAWFP